MSNTLRFVFLLFFLFVGGKTMAQITTSGIRGLVADEQSEPVVGATVLATHIPSGTRYGGVTDADGRYYVRGMRTGGPYRIVISFVGMQTSETDGVNLKLGEVFRHDVKMVEATELLSVVVISARAGIDATKTGAAMNIDAAEINRTPSVSHSIADMLRMNPQVRSDNNGAMFFLGTNNRYNSFRIDGVMNNDVYGLAANGSNGGQAGTQPVSMETIEQIQINITPFDIRQSGFTGGSVNAVTKSGTNEFHGSLYGFGNNEKLIGQRYRLMNGLTSEKYPEQYEYQAGITLGGPVVRNKLFFFANYEKADKTYQNPYAIGKSASRVDAAVAQSIWKKLQEMAAAQGVTYGGNLDATDVYTKSDKAGIRLDWNINDKQKLSFRWSLVSARQMNSASTALNLNATDYSYDFVSKTMLTSHGCSVVFNPCLPDRMINEAEAKWALEHYGLDTSYGWMIFRAAFPWTSKRRPEIKALSLTMEQQSRRVPGPHFKTHAPGDSFSFTHPVSGTKYTLTVQELERQTISEKFVGSDRWFYPTHFTAMSYTLSPEPDNDISICDCAEGDKPLEIASCSDRYAPEAQNDIACIGIIGGADGPIAIVCGGSSKEKLHAACSSLHFEPVEGDIEWRVVFNIKNSNEMSLELI